MSLVTGGASGLGRATVERIVREGGRAVICDLPTSQGAKVASDLGDSAIFAPTDVSVDFFFYLSHFCITHKSFIFMHNISVFQFLLLLPRCYYVDIDI